MSTKRHKNNSEVTIYVIEQVSVYDPDSHICFIGTVLDKALEEFDRIKKMRSGAENTKVKKTNKRGYSHIRQFVDGDNVFNLIEFKNNWKDI